MQAVLFGAAHPNATLRPRSWQLSRQGIVILDDTAPVWRDCDVGLLLLVARAPPPRELGDISCFDYLQVREQRMPRACSALDVQLSCLARQECHDVCTDHTF